MQVKRVETFDSKNIEEMVEIETESFDRGGLNEWTLPVFIRYGGVFVLEDGGDILGLAELIRDWDDRTVAFLVGFSIIAGLRGEGLGSTLLSGILKALKSGGIETVRLTVSNDNLAARRLYESFGFLQDGMLKDEYGAGRDRVSMRLDLKEQ
ncbi:MAG: GNAT family N-acetyltransferase [Actinomycetota bacterium]|nr:GNAT family N-acetyltransferase [Actinomycetota bacterium]